MTRFERIARRGQRAAERLMVDTCTIRPITGETTDPTTGTVTPTGGAAVYEGKCKIQQQRLRYPSNPDAAGHNWTIGPTEIHIPVSGTGGVATGQVCEITASADPENVGRKMRVRIGDRKTHQTAIRLLVEEVVA